MSIEGNAKIGEKTRQRHEARRIKDGIPPFLPCLACGVDVQLDKSRRVKYRKGIRNFYCGSPECRSVHKIGNKNKLKYSVNSDFFKVIDTENKAYWLGFIMADGCIQVSPAGNYKFSMGTTDGEHLAKFSNDIEFTGILYNSTTQANNAFYTMQVSDPDFSANLVTHGVVPRKTKILEFPTTVPTSLENHFIRGYLDGDGSISFSPNSTSKFQVSLVGTEMFIQSVANKLQEACTMKSLKIYRHTGDLWRVIKQSNNAISICNYIYRDATTYLERKYTKYCDYLTYKEALSAVH